MCKSIVMVDETSCVPARVLVISFTLYLIDDMKLSHGILDSLFDLQEQTCNAPDLDIQIQRVLFLYLICSVTPVLVLRMSVTSVQHHTHIPMSLYP